jgi:hypothetical protein
VVGVTTVSALCHFCRVPADFNKASVRSGIVIAGLGRHRRRPEPAAGAPALRAELALLANCSADPWDAIHKVPLPLAYLGGHPHDTAQYVTRSRRWISTDE